LRIKVAYFDGKYYKSNDIHIRTNNCAAKRYNYICLGHQNISEGFIDILILIQENPDDFWRALFRYFMDNLAGGEG